jgi:hypothetical protein
MAIGAILEPLVVVSLLAFGTIVNRNKYWARDLYPSSSSTRPEPWQHLSYSSDEDDKDIETGRSEAADEPSVLPTRLSRSSSSSSNTLADDTSYKTASRWRKRRLRFMSWEKEVTTPNTEIFNDRFLSRVLQRYPFLVEVWYWALIYWVCGSPCLPGPQLSCGYSAVQQAHGPSGLPAWTRVHRCDAAGVDRRHRQRARPTGHPHRAAPRHLHRTCRAAVVP